VFTLAATAFPVVTLTSSVTTPLPPALPLFAAGLGGLGMLRWRKRRANVGWAKARNAPCPRVHSPKLPDNSCASPARSAGNMPCAT
jgi:hypothetical protein